MWTDGIFVQMKASRCLIALADYGVNLKMASSKLVMVGGDPNIKFRLCCCGLAQDWFNW